MTLRLYLFSLYFAIILSTGLIMFIILNINPYNSPFWIILLFYLTIFFFFTSLLGLIGFYLKVWASNREVIFAYLWPTLRQGMVISGLIVALLFLQQLRSLSWWIAGLMIVALIMIELFFRSNKSIKRRSL